MSWMKGTGPIKDVGAYGVSKGLPEQWGRDGYSIEEFKKGDFWDIIDNPLYEAAAGALGYNWDEWVKESKGLVGTGPNDGTIRVRARVKAGIPGGTRTTRGPGGSTGTRDYVGTPAEYEWMTRDEADARGLYYQKAKTTRWRNKKTGKVIVGAPNANNSDVKTRVMYSKEFGLGSTRTRVTRKGGGYVGSAVGAAFLFAGIKDDWGDIWEEARDWGVGDAGVTEALDEISSYLTDIVNVNDHLHPIIREGPKGEHYGITGDIWEHYGLDEEPEPPKELEWDSYDKKMNLAKAVKSHVTYSTPEGITPIDLHSDG